MQAATTCQYSLFKTRWGWFGVLGCDRGLIRTCLPVAFKEAARRRLLSGIGAAGPAKKAHRPLQKQIAAYFKGRRVDFGDLPVCLEGLTAFQREVLLHLRSVTYGQTVSYGDLARLMQNPRASRAIGSVMAKNPLPLIIPCHRVIKTDGSLGYFSGPGGVHTKQRMLDLEKT
mgnify:CR=1 FL=1